MRFRPLLALPACFALACSIVTDLSGLNGADASSADASDAAPFDSGAPDSSVPDSSVNDSATDGSSVVISSVQIGPVAFAASGGSVAPTLPSASSKGTLLVATLTCDSTTATLGAPTGWSLAVTGTGFATCSSIWYMANNGGGITTVTFTSSNSGALAVQLSEWSGVTSLDQTGSASTSSATTSVTVSTSAALTVGGELGITTFGQATGQQQLITYTPTTGWTALGSTTGTTRTHYTADYRIGVGPGTVSESVTSSLGATWSGAIATFK